MQSLLDSLCRCFGTEGGQGTAADLAEALSHEPNTAAASSSVPTTPDMKRRTRSLALQDKQWDALFDASGKNKQKGTPPRGSQGSASTPTATAELSPPSASSSCAPTTTPSPITPHNTTAPPMPTTLEHAQAVAQAKLAAAAKNMPGNVHKRKRASPDEIFRAKKPPRGADCTGGINSPFSRFLSNHPVLANSLCFATPVKDSADDEPAAVPLENTNSVMSGNTLNTAEDTITSTLYYEQTKLKGMKQKNPPMPLFKNFAIAASDDIHQIVETRSHSSQKFGPLFRCVEVDESMLADHNEPAPPMTKVSSDSSKSSGAEPRRKQHATMAAAAAAARSSPTQRSV